MHVLTMVSQSLMFLTIWNCRGQSSTLDSRMSRGSKPTLPTTVSSNSSSSSLYTRGHRLMQCHRYCRTGEKQQSSEWSDWTGCAFSAKLVFNHRQHQIIRHLLSLTFKMLLQLWSGKLLCSSLLEGLSLLIQMSSLHKHTEIQSHQIEKRSAQIYLCIHLERYLQQISLCEWRLQILKREESNKRNPHIHQDQHHIGQTGHPHFKLLVSTFHWGRTQIEEKTHVNFLQ